jgi:DNA processing protein
MPIDARVDAWATLALKALPYRALFELLRALGDPVAVLRASRAQLQSIVHKAAVDRLLSPIVAERYAATRAWLDAPEHELIAWDDADYPRALLDIGDAPPVLFHVGRRDLLNRPSVAIVGSRDTAGRRKFARIRCGSCRRRHHDRLGACDRYRRGCA